MKLIIPFLCAFILLSCTHTSEVSRKTASVPDVVSGFDTENEIDDMSSNSNPSYLKFIVDVSGAEWKLQFFNSEKFKFHAGFLKDYVGVPKSLEDINKLAHFNSGRKYFYGALTESRRSAVGVDAQNFQISAVDSVSLNDLVKLDRLIKKALRFNVIVGYLPTGAQLDAVYNKEASEFLKTEGVKFAESDFKQHDVYAFGFTVGRLKIVSAADIESGAYLAKPDDIVVLDYVPTSLSPVRGVITSRPTSSNSHVSLLTDMLSVPFMFITKAFDDKKFKDLDGKKVFFKPFENVRGSRPYNLMEVDEQTYSAFDKVLKNRFPKINLKTDFHSISNYRKFPKLGSADSNLKTGLCGAKAANSNFLRQALEKKFGTEAGTEKSLDGFCIPFYYFETFMKMNKRGSQNLREFALSEISKLGENPKVESVHAVSSEIRKAIMEAKVSERHLEDIRLMVMSHFSNKPQIKKLRFRSSSNAEDDKRFNGAGLYDSDGIKMKHFKKKNFAKIEEALKIVWSSLYSVRAYTARRQFGIDEASVYMGVLVNQSFDEDARGVALCSLDKDEFACSVEGYPGGDLKVTHPIKGKASEISKIYSRGYDNEDEENYSSYRLVQPTTELPQGRNLFTEKEVSELHDIFKTLFKAWKNKSNTDDLVVLDFEWKRMKKKSGDKYFLVKQMREVPKLDVAGFKEPIFMIDSKETFLTINHFNEFGPMGHTNFSVHRLKIPFMQKFSKLKENVNEVKMITTDFSNTNQALGVKKVKNLKIDNWVKSPYFEGLEVQKNEVTIEMDHPYYDGMMITLDYKGEKRNGVNITDNVITADTVSFERLINKSHYPYWKSHDGSSHSDGENVKSRLVPESLDEYVDLPRQKNFCKNGKVIFRVELIDANTGFSPDDGAYLAKSVKLFKDGLPTKISKDITISGGYSVFGSGDSHAYQYPALASAQYSAYITKAQQKDLGLKKARFFVVSEMYYDEGASEDENIDETLYTTFDINMKQLKQEKIDRFCPGENPNGEGRVDPAFNGAG